MALRALPRSRAAALEALAGPVLALGGFLAVNAMAFIVLTALTASGHAPS